MIYIFGYFWKLVNIHKSHKYFDSEVCQSVSNLYFPNKINIKYLNIFKHVKGMSQNQRDIGHQKSRVLSSINPSDDLFPSMAPINNN